MSFQVFIVWLHLLGAMIWVGGLVFLVLVVGPALKRATSVREHLRLGLNVEGRFRAVMWPAVGVVLLTGLFNVINLLYATSLSGGSLPPMFTRMLALKIGLVVVMVILQAVDQLVVRSKRIEGLKNLAPEATALSAPLLTWQRLSQWLGLVIMVLAIAVVWLGVTLAR
ncbi:CopD family protein [Candidatus Entotheonella palauensis]|nr:CopD family protein [Candidatus Entotheonella palauensis]